MLRGDIAWETEKRRLIVMRRALEGNALGAETETGTGQKVLTGTVLVTVARQYRDRGDAENIFDELKNQWAWTGFTTHDLQRSQWMARIVALVFNWWSLWVRLEVPGRHAEAVTSRPALVDGGAKRTTHGNHSKVTITSGHGEAEVIANLLDNVNRFLLRFATAAEQLNRRQRWARLIRILLREFFPQKPQSPAPTLC